MKVRFPFFRRSSIDTARSIEEPSSSQPGTASEKPGKTSVSKTPSEAESEAESDIAAFVRTVVDGDEAGHASHRSSGVTRHLMIRFAHVPQRMRTAVGIVGAEDRCQWCASNIVGCQKVYQEEDGTEATACNTCFDARHAASVNRNNVVFVWRPEVPQEQISHLTRVMAIASFLDEEDKPKPKTKKATTTPSSEKIASFLEDLDMIPKKDPDEMRPQERMMRALCQGHAELSKVMIEATGEDLPGAWNHLDEGERARLLLGLRMVPHRSRMSDIVRWTSKEGPYGLPARMMLECLDVGRAAVDGPGSEGRDKKDVVS